jgi:dienelactone hydrolase
MKLHSSSDRIAVRRHDISWRRGLLLAAAALVVSSSVAAQTEAPGEPVVIPGAEISGWGKVAEVRGRFGRPPGATVQVPAVLILHGSGGVDGRGAFYAKALQAAGIATLEITMFPPGGRPRTAKATMPHAAAALKWLAGQPDVTRVGVMGFSWGGSMSVTMSSELVQERFGKDVPKPAAFVAFYPVCSNLDRHWAEPRSDLYDARKRMSATPMLILVGTRDDYEESVRPCDAFAATWPAAARELATVRYFEGATHGFDTQRGSREFYDQLAHYGKGGTVKMTPNPEAAADARQAVVDFFVRYLKP